MSRSLFLTDYHVYDEVIQGIEGDGGVANIARVRSPVLSAGQCARIDNIIVHTLPFSTTVNRLKVYRGAVAPLNIVAGVLDCRIYTFTQLNLILRPQDFLTFQFLNLDSGQNVYAKILGQYLD